MHLPETFDGTPHIVMAEDMLSGIWHTTPAGGAWDAELVDEVGDVGWGHAIAVDDFGRPHLSYVDREQQQIRYARRISSGWDRYAPTDSFPDSAGLLREGVGRVVAEYMSRV